ncbi:MAG: hypothetical protein JW817_07975 [Clostridiales bacterium]|nr:hypothetical protein [Clostridiales bacterium]
MIRIRHANVEEKKKTYEWLSLSDTSRMHMGEPDYPGSPAPDWQEFQEDFEDFYYLESGKNKGAVAAYEKVGFVRARDKAQTVKDYLSEEYLEEYGEGNYGFQNTAVLIKEES